MTPRLLPLLLGASLTGCTAIRGTVHLAKAEQAYSLAVEADAGTWAPYATERAHSLLLKAREEWGYSDFGPSEDLSVQALEWATKAREQADAADKSGPPPGSDAPGLQAPGDAAPTDAGAPASGMTIRVEGQ
jgi:hypothetical protein